MDRIKLHNYFIFNGIRVILCLQCIAWKSTKVGNEQPPKQPPDFISFCQISSFFSADFSPNAVAVRLLVAVFGGC
jgi:hypothetical protein